MQFGFDNSNDVTKCLQQIEPCSEQPSNISTVVGSKYDYREGILVMFLLLVVLDFWPVLSQVWTILNKNISFFTHWVCRKKF